MRCLSKFSCVGFGMECQTHCHRGQNSRHSYQQHFTGAFISHPHKPFPLSVFLTLASLQWLCSDIQCFFKNVCLLILMMLSILSYVCWTFGYLQKKCPLRLFAHVFIWLSVFYLLIYQIYIHMDRQIWGFLHIVCCCCLLVK